MRRIAIVLFLFTSAACGSAPSAPTTPAPSLYVLSGSVTSTGAPVVGASLEILDGPNRGRNGTSDDSGRFRLAGLQAGAFTLRASAAGMEPITRTGTLTADTTLDLDLTKILRAALRIVIEDIAGVLRPDGTFSYTARAENRGDGCASSIGGTTDLTDASGRIIKSVSWSLPTTTIVRPGDRFSFELCCYTSEQAYSGVTVVTRFTFETVPCP